MRHQRRLARIGGALLGPPAAAAAAGGSYADLLRLDGRVVVVTGAAQGIGAEVARAFAETGARVAVLDRDGAAATTTAQAIGAGAQAWECDVGVKAQVESVMQEVKGRLGSVDILVSNAGIHRRVDPVDFDEQDVDDIFTVNMKGTLNACGAAGRIMVEQGSGSIVLVSALGGGLVGLGRAGSAYGMSKGGIVALARDLAAEWAGVVRVNAVAPGWIRTPLTSALQNDPERGQAVLKRVPAGRWGEPRDVSCYEIAAIWVAFFSRCQRYRC